MLRRPPLRSDDTARKRELHRLAEARRRAREQKRIKLHTVRAGETVYAALKARNIDAKMTAEAAERATRNRKKVNADLTEIVLRWARLYLAERGKT
ncbi:hypothetical protein AB7M17_003956 [Bradyrhizobium sp. USDA 377]